MLKIELDKIRTIAQGLENAIDQYENNAMNIYLELQNAELGWQDDNSKKFFSDLNREKASLNEFIKKLSNVSKVYGQLANHFSRAISAVQIDENYRTAIINKYNNEINNIRSIKNSINNLSTYFCTYSERNTIYSEANRLSSLADSLNASKNKVIEMFDEMKKIEDEIQNNFTQISINSFDEIDVSNLI